MFFRAVFAGALALGAISSAAPVQAAESYDNCNGFIDSLPATISAQGVWCLRKHLSTSISTGAAITIAANNVTVDCNDFKLGGLAAGAGTQASGIYALMRHNATVRRCSIRGFRDAIRLDNGESDTSGGGHLVEDNRLDGNTFIGISVDGDGSVVRRNEVRNTGGSTADPGSAAGISTWLDVDVIDNTISGMQPLANGSGNASSYAIISTHGANSIHGNRIRGLTSAGAGQTQGINSLYSHRTVIAGNDVVGSGSGTGLRCSNNSGNAVAKDNIVNGFATPIDVCVDAGDNVVN